MRKITTLLIGLLALGYGSAKAATVTVNWPLSNTTALPNNLAPGLATGSGFTATSQTQSGVTLISWTGYGSDGQQNAQRVKGDYLNGTAATALPTAFQSDCYVEYSITAASNYKLTFTTVDMYLGGGGTTSIFAQVKYSTDNFATSTTLDAGSSALASNSATAITHKTFGSLSVVLNAGSSFKVRVYPKYTGSASTSKYLVSNNVNITFTTEELATTPTIAKTSGDNPAAAMEKFAMTPVVFGYSNVVDDNNIVMNWYTDNTYTTSATAPVGLSIAKNATDKTITVSGTPAAGTAGTYYYQLSVNETSGNTVQGSVVVSPYVAPTPVLTVPSLANTKYVRAGEAIPNVVFAGTYCQGATVTGLPDGLTIEYAAGSSNAGTATIKGTVAASVTPGNYAYTIKATPWDGYAGADVTVTDTIAVRNSDAARVLYLAASTVTPSQDLLLTQFLNKMNYVVTQRAPINPAPTDYSGCDLIVLHESLTGGDATTTTNEVNAIRNVEKPILNTKSFFYTYSSTASSNRWGWGTPNSVGSPKGVKAVQPSHPIFNGLSTADSVYIFNTAVAKNIQCTTADKIGGYLLAKGAAGAAGMAIHEVPGAIRLGAGKTAKYLLISLVTGKYNDLTPSALLLLDNAAQYLLSSEQFAAPSLKIASFTVAGVSATVDNTAGTITAMLPIGTGLATLQPVITLDGTGTSVSPLSGATVDFSNSSTTAVSYVVTDGINSKTYAVTITEGATGTTTPNATKLHFDGKVVRNADKAELQLFDAAGRKLQQCNTDIQMSRFASGVYFVKSSEATLKITYVK